MKKWLFLILIPLCIQTNAQFDAVSGGIGFSSGVDFNLATTGNPAIFGKAYLKINGRLHLVPGVTVFMKGEEGSSFSDDIRKNYMFHGDLDAHYGIFKEDPITFLGFAGLNVTGIVSKVVGNIDLQDQTTFKPGLNVGAAMQMRINDRYSAYLSGKYILSEFDQFVINLGVTYFFSSQRRRGW